MKIIRIPTKHSLFIISCVCFIFLLNDNAQAQFRGMGQMGGGSSTSSNAYSRSYYTQGMMGEAIIEADYDTRSIIVVADEETNKHIAEIIKHLDRPVQQVLIKVIFLEVTYRDDSDIGVEGAINTNNGGSNGGIFNSMFGIDAEKQLSGWGGFYQLLEDDLQVTMRAIQEKGKLEVLSRPSILTRNNQEAEITVGQEVPFVRNVQISDEGRITNTIEYEDIGIILRVTPFITQDGLVELILSPEISTISEETVQITDTVTTPVISKRSADTVVMTPNGKTVVIGGMMEDNNTESVSKIPILGDIPLLGMAFRRTVKNNQKTELLIFLTPYVVEGPEKLIEMSETEREQSELIPQAFPDEQLDRFFDTVPKKEMKHSDTIEEEVKKPSTSTVKRNSKGRPIRDY